MPSNFGSRNGAYKTGVNSIRISHLDELIDTDYLDRLRVFLDERVEKVNECWLWTKGCDAVGGYGTLMVGNRPHMAHRVSWIVHRGKIGDSCVLHRCDVRRCINPAHLFLGTKTENMLDRDKKKRQASGERVNTSKMTEDLVREVRRLALLGLSTREIYDRLNPPIDMNNLRRVIKRKTWAHVKNKS